MIKKYMSVVTPRCAAAAAAVVSAVVLRRPTQEYTHPYSMRHRRLPTAGIEDAPHYHQLLVGERENMKGEENQLEKKNEDNTWYMKNERFVPHLGLHNTCTRLVKGSIF